MKTFDIRPFLFADDPWPGWEPMDVIRRLYEEKYLLAAAMQPKTVAEIGVRAGYSAATFLSACPGATYHGFDGDKDHSGGWPGAPARAKAMLADKFPGRGTVTILDTQEASELPCGVVDLLHVDGDHTYNGAMNDLRLALKHCRWCLVDDLDHCPDVGQAVQHFLAAHGLRGLRLQTVRGDMLIRMQE